MRGSDRTDERSLWALALLAFIGGLGGGVVFPILPVAGLNLGIAPAIIGLILSLNRITRLCVNPVTGILVDRFGARWPLVVALLVEGLATLCFNAGLLGQHPTAWFLLGRGLWGLGSSLLMVGAMTAALTFSRESGRGRATARVRMSLSFGVPAGLLLGGLVADRVSNHAAFLSAAFITFCGMVMAYLVAPRRTRKTTSAGNDQRTPARRRGQVLRELLRPGPLWLVWLFNFMVFFSVQGVILASLVLVVKARGLTLPSFGPEGSSGILMAAMIASSALVSWAAGRWIDRHGHKSDLLPPATLCLIGGFGLLALAHQVALAAIALCVIGIGLGGVNVPLIVIMGDLVPADRYGRTIGIYQVLGDMGGSLGPITGLEAVHRFGPTATLATLAVMLALTAPLALMLWRRERAAPNPATKGEDRSQGCSTTNGSTTTGSTTNDRYTAPH